MNYTFKLITASTVAVSTGIYCAINQLNAETVNNNFTEDVPSTNKQIQDARIAVIGSGIGGSATTYFLRQMLGPSAHIDVYEKSDHVGGRLDVITLNDQTMESGGAFILNSNRYMQEFLNATGLEKNKGSPKKIGIYDGNEFVFITTSPSWKNKLKMIWRYGPFSMWRTNQVIEKSFGAFKNVYTLQDQGENFRTVPDMLEALGGETFVEYTQKPCKQVMLEQGIGKRFIDEFVTGMLRWHYGQNADNVNGITGLYSLTGSKGGGIFNVKGGNYQICQKLLQQSDANVHMKSKVTNIRKEVDKDSSRAVYYLEGAKLDSVPYDAVIVAAPLEIPSCFLTCNKCQHWPDKSKVGTYQRTVLSFVEGHVNSESFGVQSPKEMADIVLTTENKDDSFSTLVPMTTINGAKTQPSIHKVFSRKPLSKGTILNMFQLEPVDPEYSAVSWLANPRYQHPEKYLPFQLDDGVFFVNAIERLASNMEMSAIGGKNAALLTCSYLNGKN